MCFRTIHKYRDDIEDREVYVLKMATRYLNDLEKLYPKIHTHKTEIDFGIDSQTRYLDTIVPTAQNIITEFFLESRLMTKVVPTYTFKDGTLVKCVFSVYIYPEPNLNTDCVRRMW